MKRGILAASLIALVLAGCKTAPVYEAQTSPRSPGYADKQLAENRYRVSYHGDSATSRETVEDFLLRRAAEVTLKAGYSAFVFDHRDTKTKTRYYSDFAGWPGWPGYGWYWHSWDYGRDIIFAVPNNKLVQKSTPRESPAVEDDC